MQQLNYRQLAIEYQEAAAIASKWAMHYLSHATGARLKCADYLEECYLRDARYFQYTARNRAQYARFFLARYLWQLS